MIKCPECGLVSPAGALFCGDCGSFLLNAPKDKTSQLPFADELSSTPPPSLVGQDLTPHAQISQIIFVIPQSGRRIKINLSEDLFIGRTDPNGQRPIHLDLTQDRGAENGVSRCHAAIQTSEEGPVLIDLNSTNGTLLNNYRLPPDLPYPIRSGDELRFGHLLVHVFLE